MPDVKPTYEELAQEFKELEAEEKALEKRLNFLEDIIDHSVDIYWQTDLQGNPVFLSKAHSDFFGYSMEESYAMNVGVLFTKGERKKIDKFRKVITSGNPVFVELVATKKDMTNLPIEVKQWPLKKNNQIVGVCGISTDITLRKKAEEELKEQEEKYRRIAENTTDVIWAWDLEKKQYTFVSPSLKNMTGYAVEEIDDRDIRVVADEHKTAVLELFSRTAEDYGTCIGKGKYPDAERLQWQEYHKDGHVFWAESTLSVIRDENGKAIEILGVSRDVTQRKSLEKELQNRNVFIDTIINYIPIGIAAYKASSGDITFVNDLFQSIYEVERGEITNIEHFFEIVYPDPEYRREIETMVREDVASGDPFRMTWENVAVTTRTGKKKNITAQNTPLFEQDLVIATVRDITVMRKLEEQLGHAQKMESIATLAGGIAHEFNNALSVLTGSLSLMKLESPGAVFISNYINPMENSLNKMGSLTEQLLAYARGGKYRPEKIFFTKIVAGVLNMFESSFGPSISLKANLTCEDVMVEVDETQLQAAVSAVLINAIEAVEGEGQITFTCKEEMITEEMTKDFEFSRPGNYAGLIVTDDGKGMDEQTLDRIFEPFFTTKVYGRGLGMAAVYGIMKNHDGWVDVSSEQGKGTTVGLYLPIV